MSMTSLMFYLTAAVILAAAFMTVKSKNIVHSALYMVLTFLGVAGLYILLYADFLAVVQVLIYVGAIAVLMVFGIMLTRRGDIRISNLFTKRRLVGGLVAVSMFVVFARSIILSKLPETVGGKPMDAVTEIARSITGKYFVALEIAGVLLLVALVGAIVVGKGVNESK